MARTYMFKGGTDLNGYGYYAYIEDGSKLIIGENGPREGGTIYKGKYKDAGSTMMLLKNEAPKLYKSIVDYYTENPEVEVIDPTVWVENKLKAEFQKLEVEYRFKADNAYVEAMKSNSTEECLSYQAQYELNRKLSETYRMMALRAGEYAKQFKGV